MKSAMPYYRFHEYLKQRFGERVQKVTLDAGLTCPNRDGTRGTGGCIYCDAQGSGTGAGAAQPDVAAQARSAMERLARRYKARKFIAYFQSFCNTYAPLERLAALYDSVAHLPGIVGLSVATRPDCLSPQVLELLSGYAARREVWLELGLQSMHDRTLARINRGHTHAEFLAGYGLARPYPLKICLHVMLGLPGEDRHDMRQTAREVARLRPDAVKIHSLYIHRNTALEDLYTSGGFQPISQHDFVQSACDMLEAIPPDTVIQRLTGDPVPARLIAPGWALQKNQTVTMIQAELKARGSRQGACFTG